MGILRLFFYVDVVAIMQMTKCGHIEMKQDQHRYDNNEDFLISLKLQQDRKEHQHDNPECDFIPYMIFVPDANEVNPFPVQPANPIPPINTIV